MRALVLEGGGTRAAYSTGVLLAMRDAGAWRFDAVYGTSAGGALAAWWTADQLPSLLRTWDYVDDPRIVSWSRWLTLRGPLLDHDRLFADVYEREVPLDVAQIENASHPVYVTVTDADTGEGECIDIRRGPVLAWLRATGRLPLGAGPPVVVDGHRYVDGGLSSPIPIRRALDDGHREIVCVLNVPPPPRRAEPTVMARAVARKYPALGPLLARHHTLHNDSVRLATHPPPGARVHLIRPAEGLPVGRLTTDRRKIHGAIDRGRRDGAPFARAAHDGFR